MGLSRTEVYPEVWQIDSGQPGPTVTVLGGLHGNEKPGIEIVRNLLASDHSAIIQHGKLNLGIGNPAAIQADVRFLSGDYDLNRCFGPLRLEIAHTIASKRAEQLKPIIAASDVMIDIHATIKPAKPMVLTLNDISSGLVQKLISVFGIHTLIVGKGIREANQKMVTTNAYAFEQGKIGFTLETGWKDDVAIVPRTQASILKALQVIGVTTGSPETIDSIDVDTYDAYWSVTASQQFEFTGEWPNFSFLPQGTHFATRDSIDLRTPQDSYMIFQKPENSILAGEEACMLLRRFDDPQE